MSRSWCRLVIVVLLTALNASCTATVGKNVFMDDSVSRIAKEVPLKVDFGLLRIGQHSDVSTSVMVQYLDVKREDSRSSRVDVLDKLTDIDLNWRYYPQSLKLKYFQPYYGVGVGYYSYSTTVIVDTCPDGYICTPGDDEDFQDKHETIHTSGYNPHVIIGGYVPLVGFDDKMKIVIEATYDFLRDSKNSKYNYVGLMIGIGYGYPLFSAFQ